MKRTKIIKYAFKVSESVIFLTLKKLIGIKIHFSLLSMVSRKCKIRTGKNSQITFGKRVGIRENTEIRTSDNADIVIGNNCFINRNCIITAHKSIIIKEGTTIGPGTYLYDHDHGPNGDGFISKQIVIEKNVWIGANCVILKGVRIGENSVIAAGSVVSKDVPENVTLIQKRVVEYKYH